MSSTDVHRPDTAAVGISEPARPRPAVVPEQPSPDRGTERASLLARARRILSPSRLALLLVVVLGAGLVGLHIHQYRLLSVFDEPQHLDYVYYLMRGEIPASGDHWLPQTIDEVGCRLIDSGPSVYPPCGGKATADELPNAGLTTAFSDTPLYYLSPAAVLLASEHLVPFLHLDPVDAMRTTGALWLVVAMLLMWLIWRDLRIPWPVRAATLIALVSSPVVLLSQAAVTNDETQLAAGAAITLAAIRWDQRRMPTWAAALIAAAAVALKSTSLAILIMACLFVLVRRLQERSRRLQEATGADAEPAWWRTFDRRTLTFVGLFAAAFGVVSVGWSVVQNHRAMLDPRLIPQNANFQVQHFDLTWLTSTLLTGTTPLTPGYVQASMASTVGLTAGYMTNVGLLVLAVVGAVRSRPGSVMRALAIASGIAMLAYGPVLNIVIYLGAGAHFGLPARYGLCLVPALATVAANAVKGRRGQIAYVVVALIMFAAVTWHLVQYR